MNEISSHLFPAVTSSQCSPQRESTMLRLSTLSTATQVCTQSRSLCHMGISSRHVTLPCVTHKIIHSWDHRCESLTQRHQPSLGSKSVLCLGILITTWRIKQTIFVFWSCKGTSTSVDFYIPFFNPNFCCAWPSPSYMKGEKITTSECQVKHLPSIQYRQERTQRLTMACMRTPFSRQNSPSHHLQYHTNTYNIWTFICCH